MATSELPELPYYAVIFTSRRGVEDADYSKTAERMMELAMSQPGFLGADSARNAEGFGITVSYWKDLASIETWRVHAEHLAAQAKGREAWYEAFELRVAKVERQHRFEGRVS